MTAIIFQRDRLAGVYELWANGECLYVGQTGNLFDRIAAHADKPYAEVRFTEVADSVERSRVEARKIRELQPTLNKVVPMVSGLAADIIDCLGRDVIRQRLGLTPSSMSDAVREGKFPARWYGPMCEIAAEQGVDLPMSLFHWREAPERGAA